jgi:hypothetical protein
MKKTRLLEIIREEISGALNEKTALGAGALGDPDFKKAFSKLPGDEKAKVTKGLQAGTETFVFEDELEEDQLNEMAYDILITNPEKLSKLKDEIKDSPKAGKKLLYQVIDIIQRDKKENKPIRQRDIANELGLIQQKINPLVNLLIDYDIITKGESVTGVTKKAPSDKPKKEKTPSSGKKGTPAGSKKATLTPGDDGFDKVTYSDDSDEEIEDTYYNDEDEFTTPGEEGPSSKEIGSDKTAKELGNLTTGKEETFNRILGLVTKYKDDKAKVDAFISKAENEYKLPASLLNQLKRVAGREVKI